MMLIDKVRTATQAQHQLLDHSLVPYIQAINTIEGYAALLLQFYGYFKPVYDSIDTCIDVRFLPDYHSRRKPEWILNDLKDLSVNYNLQFSHQLPVINNNAAAFGALYVLEGSTLGGTIIKRMIGDKLHIQNGLSFFYGYGRHTRERWNVFTQAFNEIKTNNADDEMVIQAASSTFTFFKKWLQQSGLPQL